MADDLRIQKAQILCYRLYDVADEIDLEVARRTLSEGTRRLKLARQGSEYLQLPNPPLGFELGRKLLALTTGNVHVEATARIFDHGAISIILSVPVTEGLPFDALTPLADELYDSVVVDEIALELVNLVRQRISDAIVASHLWEQSESYTIIFAEKIEGISTAGDLLERTNLARLLLGEAKLQLSSSQISEVTQHKFSYTNADLAVVDWNSAFVWEPSGSRDIPDVLEIVNAQLLELRYYDSILDAQLKWIYDEIQRKRRSTLSIFSSPYKELARRVLATWMEMSEFIERVENSLKIIGDFYLAKVYEAGLRRMRIAAWQSSVTRKQAMLANVYQLLKGEVDTDRSLTLELAITALIVTELLVALASLVHH